MEILASWEKFHHAWEKDAQVTMQYLNSKKFNLYFIHCPSVYDLFF